MTFAVAGVLCPRPAALRQRPSIRELLAPYQPLLRHTSTLSTIAATVLGNASTWAVWTYVAAFLVQHYEVSTLEVGLIYLVVGVGVLLGTLLAGGRVGRQPRRLLIAGHHADGRWQSRATIKHPYGMRHPTSFLVLRSLIISSKT